MRAVIAGGDYNTAGLPGCGPQRVIQALAHDAKLAKLLCKASSANDFSTWCQELRKAFDDIGHNVHMPQIFPNPRHVSQYNRPLVSGPESFHQIETYWNTPINEVSLTFISYFSLCYESLPETLSHPA